MTVALILNIVLSTAVLATVVGLLVWSIATQHRDLPRAEMHTRTRRGDQIQPRPLDQSAPVRA
jgi:hypothetical protein